jgi:hypothetical protein
MKNLAYYYEPNLSQVPDQDTYVTLLPRDVSSGKITKDEIDVIKDFPSATEIVLYGLTQDTFEYFIENYGQQFKAIIFWKCPLIGNLKAMEHLDQVEYIVYFWNQRADKLWDFSKTKALKGLCFDDFTRMHDISVITEAHSLEELQFGNRVWAKYILNTLSPLKECTTLKSLSFSAKKIEDGKIEPLAHLTQLEHLSFGSSLFSTEQVAWLKARLPETVESRVLNPFWTIEKPLTINGKDTFIVGRGKPFLSSVEDKPKISRYVEQFNEMYKWYLENGKALPGDYGKTA